jgi:hypothetical protein
MHINSATVAFAAACAQLMAAADVACTAYTMVGGRAFPATLVLLQAASSEALYLTQST